MSIAISMIYKDNEFSINLVMECGLRNFKLRGTRLAQFHYKNEQILYFLNWHSFKNLKCEKFKVSSQLSHSKFDLSCQKIITFSEYVIGCMIDFHSQYYLLTLILKLLLPNYFRPSSMPVYIIKKKLLWLLL